MPSLLEKCDNCGGGLGFCKLNSPRERQPPSFYQCCVNCARRVGNALSNAVIREFDLRSKSLPLAPGRETRRVKPTNGPHNITRIETPDSFALRSLPYLQYLQSDHWKETSTKARRRAGNRCQLCNSADQLQVHHRTYERVGAELPGDLTVLCKPCHQKHHGK